MSDSSSDDDGGSRPAAAAAAAAAADSSDDNANNDSADEESVQSDQSDDDNSDGDSDDSLEEALSSAKRKRAASSSKKSSKGKGKASTAKPKKKRKASSSALAYRSLVDDEAEVDDDDEEEYDAKTREEANQLTEMEKQAHERVRRRQEKERNLTAEEQAADIERRYRRQAPTASSSRQRDDYASDGDMEDDIDDDMNMMERYGGDQSSAVAQQSLLPSIEDPKLFMIQVLKGSEDAVVMSILTKAQHLKAQGQPLGIKSVISSGAKGFIYVEAKTEPQVRAALFGLRKVFHSSLKIVPIKDMTNVLAAKTRRKPLETGQYVRLKRAPYKDDLAKVIQVINYGEKAVVQFIPRIDIAAVGKSSEEKKARKGMRPPQRWFDGVEINQAGGMVERRKFTSSGDILDWFEGSFYRNGFCFKEVSVSTSLNSVDVAPTLEEFTKFNSRRDKGADLSDESDDEQTSEKRKAKNQLDVIAELKAIQAKEGPGKNDPSTSLFLKGDTVKVISGDLMGLHAKIVNVITKDGGTLFRLLPTDAEVSSEEVEVEPGQLRKFFREGSHIRVIEGLYSGETGTIVNVQDDTGDDIAIVLTDMSAKEIKVRVAHLTETLEVAQGLDSLQGIELYDLLMLGPTEVAVVTSIGREDLEVMSQGGVVKRVKPEESRGNKNMQSMRSVALDAEQNQLRVGDFVTVIEGKHMRQSGAVKHIHRATLFLHSRTHSAQSGIFVTRSKSCVLTGKKRGTTNQSVAIGYMGTVNQQKDTIVKDFRNRSDEMLGQTVKLVKGQYKGHIGLVVEATETHVKVEMATKHKILTCERSKVKAVGNRNGAFKGPNGASDGFNGQNGPGTPFMTQQTPLHTQQTPLHAPATPYGQQTPSRGDQTPMRAPPTPGHDAWNVNSIATPHHTPAAYGEPDSSTAADGSNIWGASSAGAGGYHYDDWGDAPQSNTATNSSNSYRVNPPLPSHSWDQRPTTSPAAPAAQRPQSSYSSLTASGARSSSPHDMDWRNEGASPQSSASGISSSSPHSSSGVSYYGGGTPAHRDYGGTPNSTQYSPSHPSSPAYNPQPTPGNTVRITRGQYANEEGTVRFVDDADVHIKLASIKKPCIVNIRDVIVIR